MVSAKIFTSQLGVDHTTDFYNLIHPCEGASPSTNQEPQHPSTHPQHPLPSPHDAGNQCIPPYVPPSQHPPHYTGTEGNLIDDLDGDLYNDPHADEDELGPFSAPLGNVLDTLDGDINMCDDDDDREFNSHYDVIILNSPPKVVRHKQQYMASPSPPPANSNSFILPQKSQTPAYHSRTVFGSASPCSQALGRPSSFVSPTSLSAKPQSSMSSKKKKTSTTDIEDYLDMLNNKISNIQSNMSKRRGMRNECYAIKIHYQSQKKEFQWHCKSHSQEVFLSATAHQHKQEAKDKDILCLQDAAALQEKEAETWHLKIQYQSMMMHAADKDVDPSSLSPSV
ncbi:uncharacterized protein F5147DRAFT_768022 [Suillus discolor]|uniref:Uncharacterized protein n=1 Tax=Suillus discolor TaxID=1912936 RepID=A0A9P7FGD3_9AGAM|nr:uncharacterized protein F5147DRAFT_768022 [Suillus discolor]KAG2117884.1 hypothetical protein F5147DRAFT_768022 [Suillus discolor]